MSSRVMIELVLLLQNPMISCRTEIPKLISGEFFCEIVKSNIDVINELNIHRHKLGDLDYDPCPEINPIVNASMTFYFRLKAIKIHSDYPSALKIYNFTLEFRKDRGIP